MAHVMDAENRSLRSVNDEIRERIVQGSVEVHNTAHLHGLAAGLKHGEVKIIGHCGDYLAALNHGATIHVKGDSGKYLADNMTRGLVIVEGNTGHGAGPYCYGGTIVIQGNAGDFTAVMNKGATILIAGNVGDEAATYMLAGDLIVLGNAGRNLGNYLIRGNIYIAGEWTSLGNNTILEEMTADDDARLRDHFSTYGLKAKPANFKKIVRLSERPFYPSEDKSPVQQAIPQGGQGER